MKVNWETPGEKENPKRDQVEQDINSSGFGVDNIRVGHNSAETYIHFETHTVIMPPAAMKRLMLELAEQVHQFEQNHGKISRGKKSKLGAVQRMVKSLYKSRKVSPKLTSINTRKRKHPGS